MKRLKIILLTMFIILVIDISHALPTLVDTSHNRFLHIRDENMDELSDYFVKLDQIVSIEVRTSETNEGFPFGMTIHTAVIRVVPGLRGLNAHPSNLSYEILFKSKKEADDASEKIMEAIITGKN